MEVQKKAGYTLLLCVLAARWTASAELPNAGIHFPFDSQWNSAYVEAERLLQRQEWDDATDRLLQLAKDLESLETEAVGVEVFPVTVPTEAGFALGPWPALERLRSLLPRESQRRLQGFMDPVLKELWERTSERVSSNDRHLLRSRILRDHPQSEFALKAALEELDVALEEGCIDRVLTACRSIRSHPDSSPAQRLQSTWLLVDLAEQKADEASWNREMENLRAQAAADPPPAYLRERLKKRLLSHFSPPPSQGRVGPVRTPFLVRAQQQGDSRKAFELGSVQVRRPFEFSELRTHLDSRAPARFPHVSPLLVKDARAAAKSPTAEGTRGRSVDISLPFFPVSWDNRLFVQTYRQLIAFELPALKEVWTAPLEEGSFEALDTIRMPAAASGRVFAAAGDTVTAIDNGNGAILWKRKLAYDRPSKGLILKSESIEELQEIARRNQEEGERERDATEEDSDGEEEEADDDGQKEETVVPATLTPAVVYENQVVLGARVRVDREILIYLLAYDRDGKPLWASYVGSVQGADYLGMGSTLSPPIVENGRVYLLTNLGYVASVDVADGQIRWLQAYSRLDERGKVQSIQSRVRWQPNPVVYQARNDGEDRLFIAPRDTESVLCFSATGGELISRISRDRQTTLLGIFGDSLILGGPAVTAVSLEPNTLGTIRWRWTPPGSALISLGRAILEDDRILVSDLNALYTVDLKTGIQLSVALWDFRGGGGNLLLLPSGHLVVASTGGFLIYNDREREIERVQHMAGQSAERLLAEAKLQLKGGEVEEGIRTLQSWVDRSKDLPEPARGSAMDHLLFEIADALRYSVDLQGEDGPQAAKMLELLAQAERLRRDQAVAAFRAAKVYLKEGHYGKATEVIQDALAKDLGEIPCPINEFLAIPGRVIAEGILDQVRNSGASGEAAFTRLEGAAQEELAQSRRMGTQQAFLKVVRGYPLTLASSIAHLELANYFEESQNLAVSVRWLINYLRSFPEAENYVEVALRASNQYTRLGRYEDARDLLLTLAAKFPQRIVPTAGHSSSETVAQYVKRRLSDPGFVDIDLPLVGRWLRFPVRLLWRSPANLLTVDREFLTPEGDRPEVLRGHYLTHSRDLLSCTDVDAGLSRWTVQFAMVPSMTVPKRSLFQRHRTIQSRFQGDLLIYNDSSNILGIDSDKGLVRFHLTFDGEDARAAGSEERVAPLLPVVQERVYGLTSSEQGLFVRTSRKKLYHYDLKGYQKWETSISTLVAEASPFPTIGGGQVGADRTQHGPYLIGSKLVLFLDPALEMAVFDPASGALLETVPLDTDPVATLVAPPKILGKQAVLLLSNQVLVIDVRTNQVVSRYYNNRRDPFRAMWTFPAYPDQMIVAYQKSRSHPVLAGISLSKGQVLWEFDEFKTQRSGELAVYSDDNRLYIIHGEERRRLTALEVRPGPEREGYTALSFWPNEITLSHFYLFGENPNLLITQDSLIFHNPGQNTISVYDKLQGVHRHVLTDPINHFLIDKRKFRCQTQDGVLIFVTDRGDAGFDSRTPRVDLKAEREKVDRLRRYIDQPNDWENVIWLALNFFRDENSAAALHVLNKALRSEYLPSLDSPGMYQKLKNLLDGIKEEAVKESQPEIICRRFRISPSVDGELNEGWNFSHRVSMRDPTSINGIPVPGQDMDIWKGEEDLSATLYTGWDEDYFYFAFDVEDNRIFPYDKQLPYWKGDCLIIGLDPTGDGGLHQRGGDQLLTLALSIPNRKPNKDKAGMEGDEEEEEERKPDGLYAVKKKEDNSGVIYEVAIPWSTFGKEYEDGTVPEPGKRFGLSLVVTDDDNGQGATKMLSYTPCHLVPREQLTQSIWKHLIPEYFPKVVLE